MGVRSFVAGWWKSLVEIATWQRQQPGAANDAPAESTTAARRPQPDIEPPAPEAVPERPAAAVAAEIPAASAEPARPAPAASADLEALRAKRADLEAKVDMLTLRHAEMSQRLQCYQMRQYHALGEVLRECLALRHRWLAHVAQGSGREEDAAAARAAQQDWASYERTQEAEPEPAAPTGPGADEEEELKRLYRAAAMRCHPDRVDESRREAAHAFFQHMQQAYARRDLDALRHIFDSLDGRFSSPARPPAEEHDSVLKRAISRLQGQAADLILAIQTLQIDPAYRRALDPDAWEAEFDETRRRFQAECDVLRARLRTAGIG